MKRGNVIAFPAPVQPKKPEEQWRKDLADYVNSIPGLHYKEERILRAHRRSIWYGRLCWLWFFAVLFFVCASYRPPDEAPEFARRGLQIASAPGLVRSYWRRIRGA